MRASMVPMTQSELLALVEELRAMAATASTETVRAALTRLADRYAARASARRPAPLVRRERPARSDTGAAGED